MGGRPVKTITLEQVAEVVTQALEQLDIRLDNQDAFHDMKSDLAADIVDTLEFYRAARLLGDDEEER